MVTPSPQVEVVLAMLCIHLCGDLEGEDNALAIFLYYIKKN